MNFIIRIFNRICFRRTLSEDQSRNVVDSMVKARMLYRELSAKAHPDKNLDNREEAELLMQKVSANKHNYEALLQLEKEINKKLNK